jgi:Tol biopolymer transport system component
MASARESATVVRGHSVASLSQLKRWRVFRAAVAYCIVAFALLQIVEPIMHGLHLPDATLTYFLLALGLAFPLVLAGSWTLDLLGRGDQSAAGSVAVTGASVVPGRTALRPASLALLLILVAAVAVTVTLVAAGFRSARLSTLPKLSQVTFAEGIEEYPAWSPDGRRLLYVARTGKVRRVFSKDLETGRDAQLSPGDQDELQPAWSPGGESVLFVRMRPAGQLLQPGDVFGVFDGEADVWKRDLRTGKETWLIREAFNPAFSPSGKQIAVDCSWAGPRRIWVVDAEGHNPQQVTTDSSEEVAHVAPRWSPDGKSIVFQNMERTKFDIRVVNLETKQLAYVTNDFAADIRPVWSPSGRFIYFTSDRGGGYNLWRAPVQSGISLTVTLEQITSGAGQDVDVDISPDGRRLAFATLRQNADIWRLPVSPLTGMPAGDPQPVISTTREDSRGAWSPDGSAIAFNSDRGGEMNIWLYSLADGGTRRLTSGPGGDFQPNWSPDGKKIAFFSSRAGTPDIWTVEVASGRTAPLTTGPSIDVNPFYSPDGKSIAFQSDRSGRLEVWVARSDGGDARQLTNTGISGHFLRWTDKGDAVIFRCTCGGKPAIMSVPAAGGEPTPFAVIAGGAHISFSPDRSRIMDVLGHKVLWVSTVKGVSKEKVFEFPDPDARIDYPVWSPDGKWVLFDKQHPQGGNIWVMKDFE